MKLNKQIQERWEPIISHKDLPDIEDSYKKECTIRLLENTADEMTGNADSMVEMLTEAPVNFSGDLASGTNIQRFDPVMISMIRRSAPKMIAFDIMGVQPMNGPVGLIFALRARYKQDDDGVLTDEVEALFNEALTAYGGAASDGDVGATDIASDEASDPSVLMESPAGDYTTGTGMTTTEAEGLGEAGGTAYNEVGLTVDKISVTAKSRGLKASYSRELEQDFQRVHGLSAENELINILTMELQAEINREAVRQIYIDSKIGASGVTAGTTADAGIFDLDVDSNGRWMEEKHKGLLFHVEREANAIARETRRGKGNIILCSSDVASALAQAGNMDVSMVDDAGQTFVGVLNGQYKVYIDPYFTSSSGNHFLVVGYKGQDQYDAGMFYAPYIPLEMAQAVGENTFQPRIGFKTRYGMVSNPFANSAGDGSLTANANVYYRKLMISNIM